jgi:hypothetical protein
MPAAEMIKLGHAVIEVADFQAPAPGTPVIWG